MVDYLRRVWRLRYFWMSLVRMDLEMRYRSSLLGLGWSLVRPIAMAAVLCVVFAGLLRVPMRDYAPFLLAGVTVWQFFTEVALKGCFCFQLGSTYLRQQPMPLLIFPLRTVLGCGIHALISLGLAVGVAWYFHGFENGWALMSLAPTIVMLFLLGMALAVGTGVLHSYIPDTQHLLEIVLQMLFFLTPVMVPPANLKANPFGDWLVRLNPLGHLLEAIRRPILDGDWPNMKSYGLGFFFAAILCVLSATALRRIERRLVFLL